MPSSFIHLCVANKVLKQKQIKLNEEEFLYGNILPDYLKEKDYKKKARLHFYNKVTIGNIIKDNVNIEEFLLEHKEDLKDDVALGIYSHFITDKLWIENFVMRHLVNIDGKVYINTKRGHLRNNRLSVYIDYDKMTEWLIEKYGLSIEFMKKVKYNGMFNIYMICHKKKYTIK